MPSQPVPPCLPALAGLVAAPLGALAQPAGQLWFGFERTPGGSSEFRRFESVSVEGADCITVRRPDASIDTSCDGAYRLEFPRAGSGERFGEFGDMVEGLGTALNCTGNPADSTCLWIIVVSWPDGPPSVYFLRAVLEDALLEFDLPPAPVLAAPRASRVTLGESLPYITWTEPAGVPEPDAVAVELGALAPPFGAFTRILQRDTYASDPALALTPGPGIEQFSIPEALAQESLPDRLDPGDYAANVVYGRVFSDLFLLQTFSSPITHVSGPTIDWATRPPVSAFPSVPGRPLITTAGVATHDFRISPELACLEADYTGDGLLAIDDIAAFIDAFLSSDPAKQLTTDLTHDLVPDIADLARFVDLFLNGC
ncbi:MAG: GC-type dockerin domain-anchored protein [Phycisphaerales bacterium JB040]